MCVFMCLFDENNLLYINYDIAQSLWLIIKISPYSLTYTTVTYSHVTRNNTTNTIVRRLHNALYKASK